MAEKLIKSAQRVKEHAEVGTPAKVVDHMLGLVKESAIGNGTYSPFMRYLEPACGWGNFLEPILRDKLDYLLAHDMWDIENIKMAIGSIYAIDIQQDNVLESRERLRKVIAEYCQKNHFCMNPEDTEIIDIILATNIIVGDTINKPEELWFCFYDFNKEGIVECIKVQCLSNMMGEDYMKDLESRRKKELKKKARVKTNALSFV